MSVPASAILSAASAEVAVESYRLQAADFLSLRAASSIQSPVTPSSLPLKSSGFVPSLAANLAQSFPTRSRLPWCLVSVSVSVSV
jgi:hypothetical protein